MMCDFQEKGFCVLQANHASKSTCKCQSIYVRAKIIMSELLNLCDCFTHNVPAYILTCMYVQTFSALTNECVS